jgi:ABC-type multidrug transport system fused ATPase/permease subunit
MNEIKKIFTILEYKEKKMLFIIFLILISTAILELLNLGAIIYLINILLNPEKLLSYISEFISIKNITLDIYKHNPIIIFSWIALFILLLKSIMLLIFFWIKNKFLFSFEVNLKKKILNEYLSKNFEYHLKNKSSDYIRSLTTDVGNFRYTALQAPIQIIFDALLIILIILTTFYFKPKETMLAFFGIFTVNLIFYKFIKPYIKKWSAKKIENESKLIQYLIETFSSLKEIIIYNNKKIFIDRFNSVSNKISNIDIINYFSNEIPKHLIELIGFILILSYILLSISRNIEIQTIFFTLTLFSVAFYKLLPNLVRVFSNYQAIKYGRITINVIYKILYEGKNKDKNKNSFNKKISFKNQIKIQNLCYKYPGSKDYIVKNLNLTIKKNSTIAITGASGAGKTTLLNLIMGLLKPKSGKITSDKINIRNNIAGWQQKFSLILQDVFLFDDTVANNITLYENSDANSILRLNKSIKDSSLEKFIQKKTLNHFVGEQNKLISGGESQRIALARAIYRDSEILILDEFSSNLDETNIKIILQNLQKIKKNKTIIAITHDDRVIPFFDKVYEINKIQKND